MALICRQISTGRFPSHIDKIFNFSFTEEYLNSEMERFGHKSWVENGFPADPITSIDYYNTISFEDGTKLTQNEHKMSGEDISNLRDLLK